MDDIAKLTAYASADYSYSIAGAVSGFGRIGWQHNTPRRFVSFPEFLPGDTINRVDARIGVDVGQLSIAAFVDNLTDEQGAVSNRSVVPVGPSVNDITANRLRPRTIGVQVRFRFGGSGRN